VAAPAAGRVALLSIHPPYAEAIFEGRKLVEFRRWRLASDVSAVVVYATQPLARVVGSFEVLEVVEDTPIGLWRRYASCAGIDRQAYLAYFDRATRAFGIRVRNAARLPRPRLLGEILPGARPPQGVQYLPAGFLGGVSGV